MSNEKILDEMSKELDELLNDCGATYDPNMTQEDMDKALDDLLEGRESMTSDELDTALDDLLNDLA